jgi:hypothetical protein
LAHASEQEAQPREVSASYFARPSARVSAPAIGIEEPPPRTAE